MTPSANATLRPPRRRHRPRPTIQPAQTAPPQSDAYGQPFRFAYLSNVLLLSAVGLLFRYADFVTLLGGTEYHLGWIVGMGMVGSFFMRMALGTWIDRYGARPLWLGSLALFVVTCFAHLAVGSHAGMAIYLLRVSYCCALAGVNGASMTFVSGRVSNARLAEMVGMLGTAGFIGTVIGTLLGDALLGSISVERPQVVEMFVAAGLLALAATPFAWAATRKEETSPRPLAGEGPGVRAVGDSKSPAKPQAAFLPPSPSLWSLLRRHNPGMILVVGVAMGVGLGLPGTFLRTYAAELGIPRIGVFFLVYAVAAILTRVLTRRWTERFGPRRIILLGMTGMAASLALFLPVHAEWQLLAPAIVMGCSHAILFPAVVAAGSVAFPPQNRGLATVLMLAMWDLGLLVGSPSAGAILNFSPWIGLPAYPTMFLTMAVLLGLIGLWYGVASRPKIVGGDSRRRIFLESQAIGDRSRLLQ